MSIENPSERLERTEAYLKQRLSNYKSIMPVKGGNGATLLDIYGEWMNYLVKENLKGKNELIKKWQNFLLERHTDAIADLLIGFFEAKRRYGRDMERGEDKWDWFSLCSNYCKKNGWQDDENLLHSFFSSYSGAERRIYRKIEKGKVLADASKSILQTMALTKAEMIKKEEEKKKRAEEKTRKELEKQKRKEERERKEKEKAERKTEKRSKKSKVDSVKTRDSDVTEISDGYEDEKEVDPDYPKTPEGWSGPTDPRVSGPIYQTEEESGESRKKNDNLKNKQEIIIRDENGNLRRTTDGQYLLDFGE